MTTLYTNKCVQCNGEFATVQEDKEFCSSKCYHNYRGTEYTRKQWKIKEEICTVRVRELKIQLLEAEDELVRHLEHEVPFDNTKLEDFIFDELDSCKAELTMSHMKASAAKEGYDVSANAFSLAVIELSRLEKIKQRPIQGDVLLRVA